MKDKIEIPFGAHDSELKGWEYTIPEGMEAIIKDGKVIVREKKCKAMKAIESIIRVYGKIQGEWIDGYDMDTLVVHLRKAFAALEKQKEQSITAKSLDEEIRRFFDDCIDVHEAKLYGSISERVIPVDCYELTARHFAKWGEKQKEQNSLYASGTAEPDYGICDDYISATLLLAMARHGWYACHVGEEEGDVLQRKKYVERTWPAYKDNLTQEQKPSEDVETIVMSPYEAEFCQKFCDHAPDHYSPDGWKLIKNYYAEFKEIVMRELAEQKPAEVKDPFSNANFVRGYESGYADAKREQKPAKWSEEDREMLIRCVAAIPVQGDEILPTSYLNKLRNWLESLPERFNLQSKQEWSEEDENNLNKLLQWDGIPLGLRKWVSGLPEKVGTRPSWKPSEEQMEELELIINGKAVIRTDFVKTLYNDLKKLM